MRNDDSPERGGWSEAFRRFREARAAKAWTPARGERADPPSGDGSYDALLRRLLLRQLLLQALHLIADVRKTRRPLGSRQFVQRLLCRGGLLSVDLSLGQL